MSYLLYRTTPGASYLPATVTIAPNAAAWTVTDHAGTFVADAGKLRLTRLISDGQGYEHCAPGASVQIGVLVPVAGMFEIDLAYTGLVTRVSTYYPVGAILLDDVPVNSFTGPTKGPIDPHPTGALTIALPLSAGFHTLRIIWPICASLDLKGARGPAGIVLSAGAPRPALRVLIHGDSTAQGLVMPGPLDCWAYKVGLLAGVQILNGANGGQAVNAAIATTLTTLAADAAIVQDGFNNFYPNGQSVSTIKNERKAEVAALRAGGKPVVVMTPFWSDSDADVGTGGFAGNSPTLEQVRGAMRDAYSEMSDANQVVVEGRAIGQPSGYDDVGDGIHLSTGAAGTKTAALVAPALKQIMGLVP